MNIFKKPIPACLSAFALAGITRPTVLASALKVIGKIPVCVEAFEEIKKSFSENPQEDTANEKTLTKQETEEE